MLETNRPIPFSLSSPTLTMQLKLSIVVEEEPAFYHINRPRGVISGGKQALRYCPIGCENEDLGNSKQIS